MNINVVRVFNVTIFTGLYTCSKADLHGPLSVAKNFKLGKRYFIGHPYRIGALVPFISDIPHGVTDCNHKPVPAAKGPRAAAVFQSHRKIMGPNEKHTGARKNKERHLCCLPVVKLITVAL